MTVYKRPGIYVSETLTPLATAADAPTNSRAVFVGNNKAGGPVVPTFVSSWSQFQQKFGGFGDGTDLLPFAVYEFFNNGGGGCYVIRAVLANAVLASRALSNAVPTAILTVNAISPGAWGNNINVQIVPSITVGRWDLVLTNGNLQERFTDITLDPSDARYALNIVNSIYSGSQLVRLVYTGPATWTSAVAPVASNNALTSGAEGTGSLPLTTATQQMDNIIGNFDVNLPGVNDNTTINALITWAETNGRIFLVVDGIQGADTDAPAANSTAQQALITGGSSFTATSTVALYGPWLLVDDPASSTPGAVRQLPPGGAVLGKYGRTDQVDGVQKAPAGVTTSLSGILDVKFRYSTADLDTLNGLGFNVIRPVPGSGLCIMGARTLKPGNPDRYVSIRRALIFIKHGLVTSTQFAIFEPNDSDLWQAIEDTLNQYLRTLWSVGVLSGSTPTDAWFVQCDSGNNTPSSAASGVVNIQVGLAVASPAEFIVINIGQTIAGATVTEA